MTNVPTPHNTDASPCGDDAGRMSLPPSGPPSWGAAAPASPPPPPPPPALGSDAPPPPSPQAAHPHHRRRLLLAALLGVAVLASATTGFVLAGRHSATAKPTAAASHRPASPSATPVQPTALPTAVLDPYGGIPFSDPAGYFSASFPDTPVEDQQTITQGSLKIPFVQWLSLVDLTSGEYVAYALYPASVHTDAPNAVLEGSLAGIASLSKGTVVSKTFGTFEGYHSADMVISGAGVTGASSQGYVAMRIILAGHTLFELIVSGPDNPPASFATLTASFKILKHTP